jgi:hypothetical protein
MVAKSKVENVQLVGMCFIMWGEEKRWQYQGAIVGKATEELLICQYFSAIDGSPSTLTLIPVSDFKVGAYASPGTYILFSDDAHLRDWIRYTYRDPSRSKP